MATIWNKIKQRLFSHWVACRIVSDRQSVKYGMLFSYPVYITLVFLGTYLQNAYLVLLTAVIALLGTILPMHPFDYLYNYVAVKLLGVEKIPGRGSELQVNSIIALIFTIVVTGLILFAAPISYTILAIVYLLSSMFFVAIFLFGSAN